MVKESSKSLAIGVSDTWDIVLLSRCNRPPLRFRGRRIAHLRRRITSDEPIFVDVWARKKGDYVVAFSNLKDGWIRSDAHVVAGIADVATYLENHCQETSKPSLAADIASALACLLSDMAMQQQFAILVGDFLDDFEVFHSQRDASRSEMQEV